MNVPVLVQLPDRVNVGLPDAVKVPVLVRFMVVNDSELPPATVSVAPERTLSVSSVYAFAESVSKTPELLVCIMLELLSWS